VEHSAAWRVCRSPGRPAGKTTRVVSAEGAGGQNIYILPEYRLLVTFTERNYSTPQVGVIFLKEAVLPGLR